MGTTNTLACCRVRGKLKLIKFSGKNMLPSVLYVEREPDGSIKEIVGKAAVTKGLRDPKNCIRSSKTYIGLTGERKKTWLCHGRMYTPTDVAVKILEEVHKKVREAYSLEPEDVVQAVITIPAYFTGAQSDETKTAGERAGMEVLRIITEPVAAAVSAAEGIEGKIFVVDLGGGTFDVSVLDMGEKYATLEINGERRLGGDDFDERLVRYFESYIQDELGVNLSSQEASGLDYQSYYSMMARIRNEAREIKEQLSEDEEAEVIIPALAEYRNRSYDFSISVTRSKFDALCQDLFQRIMQVIDETVRGSKKFRKEEIKKIFLVGGSCYIPKVQKGVEDYFGFPADATQDRATQVAMGAGKIADSWNRFAADQNWVDPFDDRLRDIISHDMGIEVYGENHRKEFSPLLREGEAYPCERRQQYRTAFDNQTSVVIKVYEKTDRNAPDVLDGNRAGFDFYGSFVLDGIPPAPAGATPVEVTFHYDHSRTLQVTARDTKSNREKQFEAHKGQEIEGAEKASAPAATDFYLLLDISGSMYGNRMDEAKKASRNLIQTSLDLSRHRLGLITFETSAKLRCELTQDKNRLLEAVNQMEAGGSTNMSDALSIAQQEFSRSAGRKAIILITDGDPDRYDATRLAAQSVKAQNIDIAAIGVQDAKLSYLRELASARNLCFMVKDASKLSETFGEAVENLLRK